MTMVAIIATITTIVITAIVLLVFLLLKFICLPFYIIIFLYILYSLQYFCNKQSWHFGFLAVHIDRPNVMI